MEVTWPGIPGKMLVHMRTVSVTSLRICIAKLHFTLIVNVNVDRYTHVKSWMKKCRKTEILSINTFFYWILTRRNDTTFSSRCVTVSWFWKVNKRKCKCASRDYYSAFSDYTGRRYTPVDGTLSITKINLHRSIEKSGRWPWLYLGK